MNKRILAPPCFIGILLLLLVGMGTSTVYGQESQTVSGVVVDQTGVTLPGVTVFVKGTSIGTITDFNGQFTLQVNTPNDVLVFSFIGFISVEKGASDRQPFRIVMSEDVQSLDEVVVVGYGTQKKETVTGAISTIQSKEIVKVPTSNLSTAITGKLAGVVTIQQSGRPGEDAASIYIRGQSTWVNSSPLIIVDGVERGSFSEIDPNEVESISVLKDASSTAVYGVRGANGVILITTKRGEEGKPAINISANWGAQRPVNVPRFLGSYDHLMLRKQATINDGKDPANDPLLSDESLEGFRLGEDPYRYPNVNWYDEVVKSVALQQKYNFNVAGGTKKVKYFISMGYFNQGGMFKYTDTHDRYSSDTDYQRFNFRSNLDLNINKYQTLSANISGRTEVKNGFPDVGNMMQTLIAKVPYVFPIYNPDGTYAAVQGQGNPIAKIANSGYDNTRINTYDIVGILKNDLSFITEGLSLDMNLSFNSSIGSLKKYREQADTYEYNPFTETYDQVTETSPFTYNGKKTVTAYKRVGIQMRLHHSRKIGKSKVNTTLVYNQQNDQYTYAKPFILMGYAGRMEYDYDSKYLAEINIGYNGSENFAPGHQFGLFPAFSMGYVISQESFMESLSPVVKFLKIRGSMGLVGNDKIGGSRFLWQGMYKYVGTQSQNLQYFGFGTTNPSSLGGIYESRSENTELTWETSLKQNIGLDARLFKDNLFSLSIDVFKERRKDILMQARSLPNTTGIPSPQYNIGEVNNWGYEIDVSHRNTIGEVGYALQGNYSFARNKIINYDDPSGTPSWQKYEGNRIGQFRGYQVLGFFQSEEEIQNAPDQSTLGGPVIPGDLRYLDVNEDGQIDDRDKAPIGYSKVPEIIYSLSPEISWKGFTVSAMLQGAANASVFFTSNAGFEFGGAAGGGQVTQIHQDYWTPENLNAGYPSLHLSPQHSNKNLNNFHLKSGNYLRLRNLQLTFALPPQLCQRFNLSGVSISLSGNNLKTWSDIDGFDPETVEADGEVYPQQSVYSLGVNIKL
ncbi:MAG: TonB-dependent receptor [Marinilabiliaceae bacterium]|nr:TonB-dependent receptor [Marinilabiliaceae bacterium]